ncbi:DUF3794 and LysM peptidoglycan-binding domain-containing protein [Caldicellulosiruptor naganoensis]|uniref:DUF3794 domain-containing protein n=1 Tax=Caldicellulosiruptor naganoensis TaxID=29324 RepID=A0ABY7BG75_9FIRM|nr:SPOCS domain-containing protein [Caldicellulosiruptor naganoensis]WAM31357.1 DUF3794 domain-containing protein [Caldicellulosiruptor naganoensis]
MWRLTLELDKRYEKIEYMNVYGSDSQKVIVEGEILLPEIKPDVLKVLQTDADVFVTSVEVLNDRVVVQGEVDFKIIYLSNDPLKKISFVSSSAPFSKVFDLFGVRPGMTYEVKDDLIYSYCSALSTRKLSAKAIVEISLVVKSPTSIEYLDYIEDESVKFLKEKITISNPLIITEQIVKKEILDIPQGKPSIREILRSFARLSDKNIKFDRKKLSIDLKIDAKTLYSPDIGQNPLEMVEHEMFAEHSIELSNIPDDLEPIVKFYIKSFKISPKTDEVGELRRVEYDIVVEAKVAFNKLDIIEPIVDLYSTMYELKELKKFLTIEQFVGKTRQVHTIKEVVSLPSEPEQIFSISGRVEIDMVKAEKNAVQIKGVLVVFLIYISKDEQDLIKSAATQILFSIKIDLEGVEDQDKIYADIEIENLSFSILSASEVETRAHLAIELWAKRTQTTEIISDVEVRGEIERDDSRFASIYIYTVQKGDSLWKIAKNYRTTVEKLISFNQLENEEIFPGQKLLIVK